MPKAIRTTKVLKLHDGPDLNSGSRNKIQKGRFVNVLEFNDGWLFIQDQEEPTKLGYIPLLPLEDEAETTPPYQPEPEPEPTPEPELEPEPTPELEPTPVSIESSEDLSISPDPDQRIENAQTNTEKVIARVWNKLGGLLEELSNEYKIDVAASVAVVAVESGGRGFSTDGKMIIRFENHLFYRLWGKDNEAKFNDHFQFNQEQQWKGHMFRAAPNMDFQAFHGSQANEWAVFEFARTLSDEGAKESVSMGAPQILGSNYKRVGKINVLEMFDDFSNVAHGERNQITGMFKFIETDHHNRGIPALRNEDYIAFAEMYNGTGQAETYGALIAEHVRVFHELRGA